MISRSLDFRIAVITLIGPPLAFAGVCNYCPDKLTVKKSANPIPATYPGASFDMLGINTGMSLKSSGSIVASDYKSKPRSRSGTVIFEPKGHRTGLAAIQH